MSSEANLPQDIKIEILSRLPAKTLCGFKCVSKPWRALISDPHLIKRHLTQNIHNNKLIIVSPLTHLLYSIEFKDDAEEGVATKLEFQHPNLWVKVMGSCNGLLFVVSVYNNNFLLNPSTRESTRLPALPYALDPVSTRVVYGFGYDCSSDDYKVVAIVYDHTRNGDEGDLVDHPVDVYSVKSREWTRIGKSVYKHPVSVPWQGVFLNGRVHWLAYKNKVIVIASFDLADEVFRDLPTPAVFGSDLPRGSAAVLFYDLLVLGGCLCVVACRGNLCTDIWMMKEYGIGESWIQFLIRRPDLYPIKPFGLLEEKELLMRIYGGKMVKYNLEDQTVEDIVVKGIPDEYEVGAIYVESIVSPSF